MDHSRSTVQFMMDFLNDGIWIASNNHGLHAFLFGENCICHTTWDKDSNHGIKGIFPAKGQTCNQHDCPVHQEGDASNVTTCLLTNG